MSIIGVYYTHVKKATYKRINITLPESTIEMLESIADKGSRSSLIDNALKVYIKDLTKERLKQQLKEGAIARSERNIELAREWALLEDEVWEKYL